jgi:hypothetical protein
MNLQQRRKLRESDANNVGDFFEINFVVEKLGACDCDVRFLLVLLDYLRLDVKELGENNSNFSRCVSSFEAKNDAVG